MIRRLLKQPTFILCAILLAAGCATQQQHDDHDHDTAHVAREARAETHEHQHMERRGASQQQQQQHVEAEPEAAAPVVAPVAKSADTTCSDPTPGIIRMTKTMPREIALGKEFEAEINLTALACAGNVVVRDLIQTNAAFVRSEPAATVSGGQLSWNFGNMDAGESRKIRIWLKANKEGRIVNCATVSSDPRTCASILVVNPAIELKKSEPKEVNICDPIQVVLVVKNTGSSQLTGVKVTDNLPAGLTSDGKSTLTFDAGTLAPGEAKEFKFNATAARPGTYENVAKTTSDQGVSAESSASTVVRQAVLSITCKAREEQYLGRPFDVCFTIANTGDTGAAGTQVVLPIPAGLKATSATAGGQITGGNVVWDVGAVGEEPRTVCVTFTGDTAGTYKFNASAKGACAAQVSSSCETRLIGVSALLLEKADNPDPIQVGENTTYTVKVTNQGTADDTNIKVVVEFPEEIDPVSASNGGTVSGKRVTFPVYQRLGSKQAFEYSIVAKGVKVGDARVRFIRTSDKIPAPTSAEESTRVY